MKAGGELGRRRGRLGGVTDGRKTGIGLHDGNDTAGRLRERRCHYCDVQNRKKYRRGEGETDMWGPRVRKFVYLNSNFWTVTLGVPEIRAQDDMMGFVSV